MKHNGTVTETSIYGIAEKAGVSVATVSRVLNNRENVRRETRARVNRIIERANFRPRLAKTRATNIGILVQCRDEIFGNYLSEVVNGVFNYCIEFAYNLQLFSIYENRIETAGILNTLRENRIDGIIVLLSNDYSAYIREAEAEKYPHILVNNGMKDYATNFIDIDNGYGITGAMEYLFSMGHRKIVFLPGDEIAADHAERSRAFAAFMKKKNIYREKSIAGFLKPEPNLTSLEQGYRQMKEVLNSNPGQTAVLANNDDQAIGAIRAVRESGLSVPDDISIIGFDDYPVSAYTNPPLTTIKQPLHEMGRMASAKLITLITGASTGHIRIKLKPELVIRQSVRKISV